MASASLKGAKPNHPEKSDRSSQQHSVRAGDEVYFTGPAGVNVGKVVCFGKHGATLDCDGQRAPVRWEHLLGHKARASFKARVVDQGEDGMVVEDETGERSYLEGQLPDEQDEPDDQTSGPADQPEPQQEPTNALYDKTLVERKPKSEWDMMGKSMPVLFFLKGMGTKVANRPGLALQQTQDSAGHTVKRWKKTGQDQKKGREPAKQDEGQQQDGQQEQGGGRQIAFHHHATGEKTTGTIAASGADGVTVHDDDGNEHHIKHGDYHPHTGDDGPAANDQPSAKEAKPKKAAESKRSEDESTADYAKREQERAGKRRVVGGVNTRAYASPIKPEDTEGVPKSAEQPIDNSIDALYEQAREALPQYQEWADKVAEDLGGYVVDVNKGGKPKYEDEGFQFIIGPIKKAERVKEKAEEEAVEQNQKEPDFRGLKDIVRGTIAVDSLDDLQKVWKALKANNMKLARTPKDRYQGTGFACEYRDMMMNVEMPNGHVAELQINVKTMLQAKEKAHKQYEEMRTLAGAAKAQYGKDKEDWPPGLRERHDMLERKQVRRYRKAWADMTKGAEFSKALKNGAILFLWDD